MTDAVELVARALCEHSLAGAGNEPDDLSAAITDRRWHLFVPQARVAIAALREPTPAMIASGWMNLPVARDGTKREADVAQICRAMIDAALGDAPK